MTDAVLHNAIATVPSGAWAVGVSGGADSVAVLLLLRDRADLRLVVAHLDHETRGEASAGDAAFVADLAGRLGVACAVARRSEIEPALPERPGNPSALYRACRLELFRRVVREHGLDGVILAHHADDQAETVLQRLLRGSPAGGLAGMAPRSTVGGLQVLRPMLGVGRDALRRVLADRGQAFREDASNASDDYLRNRLRKVLAGRPGASAALRDLAGACRALKTWTADAAPQLGETFAVGELADLPRPLAREAARRWLVARGCPPAELSGEVLDRLVLMASDAASVGISQFPARVQVRRRRGMVSAASPGIIGQDGSPSC